MTQHGIWKRLLMLVAVLTIGSLVLAACGDDDDDTDPTNTAAAVAPTTPSGAEPTEAMTEPTEADTGEDTDLGDLEGEIDIDGSSTVYPVTQAVAEEFTEVAPNVQIQVAQSGTGGGFERFCAGEIQISDASRPISDDEIAACEEAGVEWTQLQVGVDGLSVVVNSSNDFVTCMTVEQLGLLWMAESEVASWSDLDPSWPDEEIALYGPGTDSGTFDYFVEVILEPAMGDEASSRGDYTASEDDSVLVQGIIGDENALGYFGYAYYVENQDDMNVVAVDNGAGCVEPNPETVESGEYAPLSRPLFIYINNAALTEEPALAAFVDYYLNDGLVVVPEVGYISMSQSAIEEQRAALAGALGQ